jgi:hypothetical protein
MKNFTVILKSLLIVILLLQPVRVFSQSTASYTINFSSNWESETLDPVLGNSTVAIPGNAHWSNFVGATHNSNYTLVEMGTLASIGVKNVAELGNNNALFSEVNTQITNGTADQWLQESFSPFDNISVATLNDVVVNSDFPLLSLVSMIAPSPDWMIAINSVNLREGGSWNPNISIPLFPYDAGTDSGVSYTSSDQPTMPNPEPISVLINQGPFNAKPIGTLTISLNEVLNIVDQDFTEVNIYPNPSKGIVKITSSKAYILKEVFVFDILGKRILSFINQHLDSNLTLDLSTLNKGIYVLRIELQDGSHSTKRIVIN